jgi:hypothetical protein
MDEVLAKGQGNDIQKIARALQSKGDLATLFPNPRDLQDAQLAVKFMQQVLAKESASGAGGRTSAAYAATRAAGGTSVAGLIAGEFASLVNSTLSNPAALSKMLFEPDNRKLLLDLAKKKTTSEKAYNAIKTLSQNTGVIAARGGPALDVGAPESPATAMPTEQTPDEEAQLEAEMRRRGMLE